MRSSGGRKKGSWICLAGEPQPSQPPQQYIVLAERHWRTWLPRLVAELERTGQLQTKLREAAASTVADTVALQQHFHSQGMTPAQASQRAWEIACTRYLFLQPEE
jgi:hypothetical protein